MTRREVNLFLGSLAVALLLSVLFVWVLFRHPTPAASAAPVPMSAGFAAQPGGISAELVAELGRGAECRQAARAFVQPAANLRRTWGQHAEAHHKGMLGEITEDEMHRRWKVTLARRLVEDPLFGQAWGAMTAACGK